MVEKELVFLHADVYAYTLEIVVSVSGINICHLNPVT
jgi:hypothetical protein